MSYEATKSISSVVNGNWQLPQPQTEKRASGLDEKDLLPVARDRSSSTGKWDTTHHDHHPRQNALCRDDFTMKQAESSKKKPHSPPILDARGKDHPSGSGCHWQQRDELVRYCLRTPVHSLEERSAASARYLVILFRPSLASPEATPYFCPKREPEAKKNIAHLGAKHLYVVKLGVEFRCLSHSLGPVYYTSLPFAPYCTLTRNSLA